MMKSNIKEKGDISENSVPSREIMILSELFVLLICIVFFFINLVASFGKPDAKKKGMITRNFF